MNTSENETSPGDRPVIMNALLAEFNGMRAEIIFRATSQATLMQLNITAAGTVAVFALAEEGRSLTMIIIPILSPILGLLWLDHDATITKLGHFIKTRLKPAYGEVVKGFCFPDYQSYAESADAIPATKMGILNFIIAVFATFGALPLAAFLYVIYHYWEHLGSFQVLAPAILAILLLLTFFIEFLRRFGLWPAGWATSREGAERA
jgi:sorbitol-specific phosphotransferase system component IIC